MWTRPGIPISAALLACACGSGPSDIVAYPPSGEPANVAVAGGEATQTREKTLAPPAGPVDMADPDAVLVEVCRCRARLAALRVFYGKAHPNVAAAEARISALEQRVGELEERGRSPDEQRVGDAVEALLAEVKVELAVLETRYGPRHPKVRAEQAKAESLQAALAGAAGDSAGAPSP